MALRIAQKDPVAVGERWEDFDADTSIKVAGIDSEDYQIALERARRLIAREDDGQTLNLITTTGRDVREHDIQCALLGRYIIRDWKGDVLGDDDKPVAYSPEAAKNLLTANIGLFAWVITMATKVAVEKNAEVAETVKKPLRASSGNASGRAKPRSAR